MGKNDYPNLMAAVQSGRGAERPFCCDVHGDSNPSASVNVLKGVWVCYACGAGGRVGTGDNTKAIKEALAVMRDAKPPHVFHPRWLDMFDIAGPSPYWASRVGETTARAYRCGTHPTTGNPTYPLLSAAGEVWGVVERVDTDAFKYLYPAGVSVSKTLFGYRKGNFRTVIVCEGAGDVMAFHTVGIPKGTLVVGTYGAGVNAPQAELIRNLSPVRVIMAYDNDEAGVKASRRNYDFGAAQVAVVEWPEGVKDPGDAPADLLRKEMSR
jgi:DNA primase